jgi:hypothetical protein
MFFDSLSVLGGADYKGVLQRFEHFLRCVGYNVLDNANHESGKYVFSHSRLISHRGFIHVSSLQRQLQSKTLQLWETVSVFWPSDSDAPRKLERYDVPAITSRNCIILAW